METYKTCIGCEKSKPVSEFYKSRAKGYYQARCKMCNVKQVTEYRSNNKDKIQVWSKTCKDKNKRTPKYLAQKIRDNMNKRSRDKGFALTEWTKAEIEIAISGSCCKTDIPFEFDQSKFSKSPWTPVPDRIDSSKGYTKENVQWVCHMYNSMKQDYTEDEIDVFISALISKREGNF